MKRLSEIKDDESLIVGDEVLTKEDLLNDIEYYRDKEVYTATEYKANINASDMLDYAIECEDQNMYDGWIEEIFNDVAEEDIRDLQVILDRILSRSDNISYQEDEEVEIDI